MKKTFTNSKVKTDQFTNDNITILQTILLVSFTEPKLSKLLSL